MAKLTAKKRKELEARKLELKQKLLETKRDMAQYRDVNAIEFFKPNPLQDKLLDAWKDVEYKVFTYTGANRIGKCQSFQTLIDTAGGEVPLGELYKKGKPFEVYSWDGEKKIIAQASPPFRKKGLHECYRVEMSDGRWVEAADYHRVLTDHGWLSMKAVYDIYSQSLPETNSESCLSIHGINADHLNQKQLNYQDDYSEYFCRNGEPPLFYQDIDRVSFPSQGDVQRHGFVLSCWGGLVNKCTNIYQSESDPPSILDVLRRNVGQYASFLYDSFDRFLKSFDVRTQFAYSPIGGYDFQLQSNGEFSQSANRVFCNDHIHDSRSPYLSPLLTDGNHIININPIGTQEVYDFEVEKYRNYFAGGMIHHNTTIGAIIAISVMAGEWIFLDKDDPQRKIHFPHKKFRKIRYIGQDWEKQIQSVVIPALKKWWPKNRLVKTKKNGQGVEALWTDEKSKSTLEIMSNKQESELHEGWDGDLIIYDEPPKRNIRVANARGLIDRRGRELFCMTLLKEAWVDREVIKAVNEDGSPDMSVFNITGDIYSNVGFGITEEGVDQFKKTLTEDEKEARILGIPSYMSGLVYPQFNRKKHLKRRFDVPLDWVVDIAIDIHPRERQAVLFLATNPMNQKYLVNEIWAHGDGTWVGEQIVRCVNQYAYRVNQVIVDPLAKGDRNNPSTTYEKIAMVLGAHEMLLETATKDKDAGIIDVKNALMGPNQEPSIFIFNDLIRTIFEIEGYMFDEDTQKPQDKDDHMMENLYRLMLLDTEWYPEEYYQNAEFPQAEAGRSAVTGY